MRTFSHQITEKEEGFLAELVGLRVSSLFSRSLEVEGSFISASNFSLSTWQPDRHQAYCLLDSDWCDTPDEAIDDHMLEVHSVSWPKGIRRLVEPGRPDSMFQPSQTHLGGWHESAVSKILLLETHTEGVTERVRYDTGIVCQRLDGYRFAVSTPDSIVGGLRFTDAPAEITRLIGSASVRRRFAARGMSG